MDFHSMKRRQLQDLCKKHNLPANKTNLQMAESLSLIFKEETKSIGSSGEVVSENSSGVVAKRAKKVTFCLEEGKIEVIDLGSDSDERVHIVPKEMRRKSILKPQPEIPKPSTAVMGNLVVEEVEKGDIPVRVTRSRVRKSMVLLSPREKRKKSKVDKNSTENVCRNDKVRSGSSLLGDGVSDDIVALENDLTVRRSLRNRSTDDVCPERIDIRSTRTRKKSDRNVEKETIVPMTRSLRSRKIDVVPEKTDTNLMGNTKRGKKMLKMEKLVEDVGIAAKKLAKKRSNKMDNADAVEKRETYADKTMLCVTGQEEIGNTLETGEAVKQLNTVNSPKQFLTKTELVAGAEIAEKPSLQFDELIRESSHENDSTALVSDSEYVAKVEGNKKESNYQEPRRRSQQIAPKSVSFAPNVEHESENVVQPEEEDGQALPFLDPRNCDTPQPSHELSSLVSEDQNVVQSKRKMHTKSKGLPRRSRRNTYINKVRKKVEEPFLEEDDSLLDALVAEDSRPNKSQNIVLNDENSPSNHLVNADEDKQNDQGHCDDVVLMEKESIVTEVDYMSLPSVSDQMKEIMNRAIPFVEEIINGNCREEASMMLNESRESAETGEISDNYDACSSDTILNISEDYVLTNLEDKAMTDKNFACETDIGFVEEGDMEKLERSGEEHDNVECGASPIIGVTHDDSDERVIEGEQFLDETVTEVALSCESGRSQDEGHAMKSKHMSPVVTNGFDVESDGHTPESLRQLVFQDEAGEEVPQVVESGRMGIQQSEHEGNVQYGKISVNEHEVGTNCCVTDRDVELEDHKGFVSEGGFVEHEEADSLSKSRGTDAFDIAEARNEAFACSAEDTDISSQIHVEVVDISEAGSVANEAIKITLDEHEIDLQVTEDSIIVEGEEISNTQGEKDASAKKPKEESGELAAAMGKESRFPGQNDINEESHVGGTKPLVSLVPFSFNEENQMNEERIEENCICENIEAPAEEGKHPGVFELTGSSEMVDMNGLGRLAHAHVNPVFNELILEESRHLKENLAQTEITDCVGGTYATDCGVDTIIQPQIVVVEPFQDCFSTEQSGTTDDRHWNEIFSSQHTEPRQSWSAIDDQNDFNHRGEGAGQEESVHTIDEPILDHLKMLQRNEVSFNVCEVREYAASGTRLNTEGARHVDCIESEEVNTTSQVIPQANEITVVGEAEKHLVYLAKEVQNDIEISMGEHIAIMDEDGLHSGSTHQNGKESTERCVSRLENISQIAQKSEESRKPTATELGDNMEEERYGVGHVDDSTFSEDQNKKEDMVEYDPEPDELAGASSVLQQPRESVLAELSIINDCGLCSPFEILTSSRSAGRNLDDRSVFFSGSIVSHHHNESQAVSSEAIVNDSEDVERASDAEVSVQSVSRNFSFGDFFENVQLSETFKLETSGKLSEKKGSDHVVEENEGTIEQYRESKLTELVVEEKLEANASSAPEVKAAVQSCLIDFDVDNNEEASASLTAKYCTEYSEGRDTIVDENKHSINKIGPTSPFTSQVDELSIIKDAENEDVSSQTFTLELADYEDYDGRVHDGMEVAATLKEPTYDKITEKNSNAMVEENCILMDSRVFVLEEETSSSPTEISSGAQKLLGSNEIHMKADLDGPTCNFDASENFGDQEYACQVFPENHCNNEDLNTEQYIRTNGSENAVLGDAIFDYSGAEIKGRAVDLEDLIETENISESSLERIKASGRSVRTSLCQAESGFQTEVDCNKDNSRMRKSFVSAVNVADDRGGDDLELLQDCTSNADFPHLQVDQAEDQEGTNEACNANSTDQENDNNATFFRSPLTVEKEESNGPTPGSVVEEEIKGAMDDINSQLRKMHISSTIKWRGKASMTPKECKKSFEAHDQLASNMKENITSMKCVKSGNCSEKQSAFKRRALKDLHGSKMRYQSCYTPYKQQ